MAQRKQSKLGAVEAARERDKKARIEPASGLEKTIPFSDELLARARTFPELLAEMGFPLHPGEVVDLPLPGMGGALEAVTQFARKGVPDKALREKYTAEFLERAKTMFPEAAHSWLEEITRRFPRLAAHSELRDLPFNGINAGSADWIRREPIKELLEPVEGMPDLQRIGGRRIPVNLHEGPPTPYGAPGERSIDTLLHEMTHVAQALGNADAPELYRAAYEALGGKGAGFAGISYENNPFERTARQAARRKTHLVMEGSQDPLKITPGRAVPLNANNLLRNIVELGVGVGVNSTNEQKDALLTLRRLLRRRGQLK
jgi:hypothetical protein